MPISLKQTHGRHLLSGTADRDELEGPLIAQASRFSEMISKDEMIVRCLGYRDKRRDTRIDWLQAIAEPDALDLAYVVDSCEANLLQGRRHFDLLLMHGNDYRRLQANILQVRSIFRSKPIVALMNSVCERDVPSLLKSGYDDVLTIAMPPGEARARLRAMKRRNEIAMHRSSLAARTGEYHANFITHLLEVEKVNVDGPRKLLLHFLTDNIGRWVTYDELISLFAAHAALAGKPVSRSYIYLLSYRLRALLPANAFISSQYGVGIKLDFVP